MQAKAAGISWLKGAMESGAWRKADKRSAIRQNTLRYDLLSHHGTRQF